MGRSAVKIWITGEPDVVPGRGRRRVRRFPPRIMRHTAASWLVQDGVPLYDVQALRGHEDYGTTQRYAHLAPGAHGKVIESFRAVLTSVRRVGQTHQ